MPDSSFQMKAATPESLRRNLERQSGKMKTPYDNLRFRDKTLGTATEREVVDFLKQTVPGFDPNGGWLKASEVYSEEYQRHVESAVKLSLDNWFKS